jgi:hypothetical protein
VAFKGDDDMLTLAALITAYQTDPTSTYHALRYHVRMNHESMLRRLTDQHGKTELSAIRARDIKLWHMGWSEGGKLSVAKAFLSQLSTMCGFGLTMLENEECERLSLVLSKLRFPSPKPRKERVTAQQATAIRMMAHEFGWHSIALAQAFQFELMLRQKDVIGEMVPFTEPGESDIRFRGQKWLRGIRWEEVNENLILTHTTSKKQKDIKADLKISPMIVEELAFLGGRKASGAIVINEITGAPWSAAEFRRKWRIVADAAGVPKEVRSMDSRAGGISEAFEAGVDRDHIRQSATHSDVSQTEDYNRTDLDLQIRSTTTIARVEQRLRANYGEGR